MATRAIKPKREDTMLSDWQSMPEIAPSMMRREGNVLAQIALFLGFFLTLVGVFAMLAPVFGWSYFIGLGGGYFALSLGLAFMLYHCFADPEAPLRRLYAYACLATLVVCLGLRFWRTGEYFLPVAIPLLFVVELFLIGILRKETDATLAKLLQFALLVGGVVMITAGLLLGFRGVEYLTTEGILLLVLGLAYVGGFIGVYDHRSGDLGHNATLALGAVGIFTLLVAASRSWVNPEFLVPSGLILGGVGILYALVAFAIASDVPVVVLFRRELTSYFYSPIAYLVLFGLVIIFGFNFYIFVVIISESRGGILEPIIRQYVYSLFPVVAVLVLVPVLTMRLLSEDKRTGSLEVLLTAPVNEWSVTLGKFFAALAFYLIAWAPFFLYLISLRVFSGQEFDYRPTLSFLTALTVTGAGFLAMGLFFSSLTSNQIIAAVLTFAGMLLHLGFHWMRGIYPTGVMNDLFTYVSFLDLWRDCAQGYFPVRYFVFHVSAAVFFLYLTNLVLSSRRWK